jgi:hypothetical protein
LEDSNWASITIPEALAQRGWFDPESSADAATSKSKLWDADIALMAKAGIVLVTPEMQKQWLFDPIAWKWIRRKDLNGGFWNRENLIIHSRNSWTEEEHQKAKTIPWDGEGLVLPPIPDESADGDGLAPE